MLTRPKFITNSSSSSFYAFGIEVSKGRSRMADIAVYCLKDPAKKKEMDLYVDNYYPEKREAYQNDPKEFIKEQDLGSEVLEFLLPDSVYLELPPWDDFYLCIGYPNVTLHEDGTVSVVPDILLEGFNELNRMIDELGLPGPIEYVEDTWYG